MITPSSSDSPNTHTHTHTHTLTRSIPAQIKPLCVCICVSMPPCLCQRSPRVEIHACVFSSAAHLEQTFRDRPRRLPFWTAFPLAPGFSSCLSLFDATGCHKSSQDGREEELREKSLLSENRVDRGYCLSQCLPVFSSLLFVILLC